MTRPPFSRRDFSTSGPRPATKTVQISDESCFLVQCSVLVAHAYFLDRTSRFAYVIHPDRTRDRSPVLDMGHLDSSKVCSALDRISSILFNIVKEELVAIVMAACT